MRRQPLLFIGLLATGVLVAVIVLTTANRAKSPSNSLNTTSQQAVADAPAALVGTGITTIVVPTSGTTIKVNDTRVKEGNLNLKPGSYTIVVSHEGFATETRQVTLKENDQAKVAIALTSNSVSTKDWYNTHADDGQKAERIGGILSQASADAKRKAVPLISELPVIVRDQYRIDYGVSVKDPKNPAAVAIYITAESPAAKQAALNWITYRGYDPASLEIIYKQTGGRKVPVGF